MPSATVTFLFTDIEGSTQLWERHPRAMQAVLARHDALLRLAIEAHAGRVIKTTGDGCHAVFSAALDAALAAVAAQQALVAEPWAEIAPDAVRVRMALHTGEAEARDGDYYGPALNRAARLMAAGHGGQVLLSQVTADLAHDQLPAEASLRDLGQHRLKDLTRPEHIFQLSAAGLPADFPALRSLDATPHNLPVQLTHLIGREHEIGEVRELLTPTPALSRHPSPERGSSRSGEGPGAGVRLLTLTGSGGTGKTRLSLQVAAELLPKFPDGAWLVELAPVTDPELVVQSICAALDVRQQPRRSLLDSLSDFLSGKQLLLILDNCEHLITVCAQVAEALLRQCSRLKILASSREALGIAGETTYPVPSLSLPQSETPGTSTSANELAAAVAGSEAARLFVDRAQATLPSFALTEANAAAVATICRRLDGIPLAIELAAARVKLLSVEQIAARLDDRFRLLTGGSRTALPRQQTLRALIDWSYALLSEPERQFLRVLSVFAGGWTLEAAEAIAKDEGGRRKDESDRTGLPHPSSFSLQPWDVLDLLSQLTNKSLIVVDQAAEPRYRLLETIRQYARDKLFEISDPAHWRTRHLQYFLHYATGAQPHIYGRQIVLWLNRFDHEVDNFRAAMEWALETNALAAMQLAEALSFYQARRGNTGEALGWMTEAASRGRASMPAAAASDQARAFQLALARLLAARAIFDFGFASSGPDARAAAQEAVQLARPLGDTVTLGRALGVLGMTTAFWGDPFAARPIGEEALALGRETRDAQTITLGSGALAVADQVSAADPARQAAVFEEELRAAREAGNLWMEALATLNLARSTSFGNNLELTRANYDEALRLFAVLGDTSQMNVARSDLAHALRRFGQYDEAVALYHETLRRWQHIGHRGAIAHQLECLAVIALARRQPTRAARLLGAAEVQRETSGAARMAMEHAEYDAILTDLRAQLAAAEIDPAWAAGRALSLDEAVEYALSDA